MIVKAALDDVGLVSFPKTSGSRGLHVLVPLRIGPDFDEVLSFAEKLCERLAAAHPRELTVESRIEDRQNRVYLDALRNAFGATVAAPYSVRRRPGGAFSMPLRSSEVKPSLVPSDFNIGNYKERLAGPDPWKDFFRSRQSIRHAAKNLARMQLKRWGRRFGFRLPVFLNQALLRQEIKIDCLFVSKRADFGKRLGRESGFFDCLPYGQPVSNGQNPACKWF